MNLLCDWRAWAVWLLVVAAVCAAAAWCSGCAGLRPGPASEPPLWLCCHEAPADAGRWGGPTLWECGGCADGGYRE